MAKDRVLIDARRNAICAQETVSRRWCGCRFGSF